MISLSVVLIGLIARINCGFFDKMNVGLTIPAMSIKVPSPGMPKIKVDAHVKMPPKQSLRSLLPKFKYNIPTFDEEYYPTMHYASSNQQNTVHIAPAYQTDKLSQKTMFNNQPANYAMSNQMELMNRPNHAMNHVMNQKLNDQINYQASNQFNRYTDNVYSQTSNQRFNYPNHLSTNYRTNHRPPQFDRPVDQFRSQDNRPQSVERNHSNQMRPSAMRLENS